MDEEPRHTPSDDDIRAIETMRAIRRALAVATALFVLAMAIVMGIRSRSNDADERGRPTQSQPVRR